MAVGGISVVFAQQGLIYSTKKPLVAQEISENLHSRLSHTAMPEKELEDLTSVPSYRLEQFAYWDIDQVIDAYALQDSMLSELAGQLGAGYVAVQPFIDKLGRTPVFSSSVHYTYRGADLVGRELAKGVLNHACKQQGRNIPCHQ